MTNFKSVALRSDQAELTDGDGLAQLHEICRLKFCIRKEGDGTTTRKNSREQYKTFLQNLLNKVTNSMELSPSREAASCVARQEHFLEPQGV
jgi:hypothetical protein